jgi:hypothetical protein
METCPTTTSLSTRLVPRPQYFAAVNCGPSEKVRPFPSEKVRQFPKKFGRSSRLRHRNELTVMAWEEAVQELQVRTLTPEECRDLRQREKR